ncbi:hypothetical protein RND71_025076 [Anisodus tanguticus]|uniref:Uncharacterized protein n=1 Tax=Anisodus tanguticus TaxID=243964 RepID=A0AAE1RPI4_9SOLA|nr:hypothetical protein RND71_025076 [Anisodus tanguticus]
MIAPPFSAPSANPGLAAKFSCFSSPSFNGRTSQFELNNDESGYGSCTGSMGRGNLSSPSLVQNKNSSQTQVEILNLGKISGPNGNSNEECSISEQVKSGEIGSKTPSVLNSRKRKGVSRGKGKNNVQIVGDNGDGTWEKICKLIQGNGNNNGSIKMEEQRGSESDEAEKEQKGNQKIINVNLSRALGQALLSIASFEIA